MNNLQLNSYNLLNFYKLLSTKFLLVYYFVIDMIQFFDVIPCQDSVRFRDYWIKRKFVDERYLTAFQGSPL